MINHLNNFYFFQNKLKNNEATTGGAIAIFNPEFHNEDEIKKIEF
jgi:hypothetical protein